jgi:hypothetical protein
MTSPLAEYTITTWPAHSLITLRDQDNDAAVDAGQAIATATAHIVASTGHELYLRCAQDLLPVTLTVTTWGSPPDADALGEVLPPLPLEVPTAQLVLGSPTGEATALSLPTEPGLYTARIQHSGRTEARRRRDQILAHNTLDTTRREPIESYTIHLWRTADLPNEDNDNDV